MPGSADHPLVGRFEGSTIIYYKQSADDQAALLQAPHDYGTLLDNNALGDRSGSEWLSVEGRITKIRYEMPPGHGSFEVDNGLASKLEGQGFKLVFSCDNAKCFTGALNDDYLLGQQLDTDNSDTTRYFTNLHYFLAALNDPQGSAPTYVSLLVGEDKALTTAFVEVVEPLGGGQRAQDTSVNADQMATQLADTGSVNIYGLHFATNSAALNPDSIPTLDQIAQLLHNQPQLRLAVVGHTDNQGSEDYNLGLSQQRALTVATTLVDKYGIPPQRLEPSGRGFSQPVASNDTAEGRAQNRRVELIALH
ncbi:MAG TPA: DUF4892 domain-containing protein [Hyphomicrobiaceae bacterium]|nr:DUF4892 domain-containing protein [Hyphomicrobiaceae bacterium]